MKNNRASSWLFTKIIPLKSSVSWERRTC